MNIYVETNFVLELTLLQGEQESCEHILSLCESGRMKLVIPAYSLAEPNEKLVRQERNRKALAKTIEDEFKELSRSIPYKTASTTFQEVISLLRSNGAEDQQRFTAVRDRLLKVAEIIPLDGLLLASAVSYEKQFGLSPQDALVFASILQHLSTISVKSCFVTLNSKDFNDIDMRRLLEAHNCKSFFDFDDAYSYVHSQI